MDRKSRNEGNRAEKLILDASFLKEKFKYLVGAGIGIVLLSPLPYGNVEIWSVSIFEMITFFIFGVWLTDKILKGRISLPPSPLYKPFAIFFLLIFIQLIALPSPILDMVSSHAAALRQAKEEALIRIFGEDISILNTVSLYSFVTYEKLLLYLSYAAFFIVSADFLRSRDRIKKLFWVVFTIGVLESLIGLLQYITSGTTLPASGTYINPNHFAGLLLTIIPLILGYLIYVGGKKQNAGSRWETKTRIPISNQIILLFVVSLMAISLILSQSRGAIFAFVSSVLLFYYLISRTRMNISVKWVLGIFMTIVILYSLWIGLDPVIEKFSRASEELPNRTFIWKDSLKMITDFPLLGVGLGNYSLAYTLYKKEAFWPQMYEHAHNDYIELASEMGIIGFIMVFWGLIVFFKLSVNKLKEFSPKRDPLRYYLFIGSLCGMIGMMIHSITEFNFQIPSNAYYFTFLLALSTALFNRLNRERSTNQGIRPEKSG